MPHRHPRASVRTVTAASDRRAMGPLRTVQRPAPARVAAVALAAALLGGSVAGAHDAAVRARVEAAAVEAADAARAEQARQRRVAHAATARLEVEFAGYAAVRRAEALDAARAAVQVAEAVVVSSAADVPAETVVPLDAAVAELTALIAATPQVPLPLEPPEPTGAAPDVPGTPGDAIAGAAAAAHAGGTTEGTVPAEPTPGGAEAAAAAAATVPETAAATPDPRGSGASGAAPGIAAPTGPAAGTTELPALDLSVTADVLAAAHRLTVLSAEVSAAAEAAVAAAEAKRIAALEAARAEAETARRVEAARTAPNGEIAPDVLCPVAIAPDALLRCDAAAALDRLAAAYRADIGHDLRVVSTYRSLAAQVAIKASRGALAAEPGRSNHGRGLAVDLGGLGGVGEFTAPAYLWMQEHAATFGWHHPAAMEPGGSGPQEPWHWEYGTDG